MANRHKPRGVGPCLLVTPIDQTQTENRLMTIVHSRIATRLALVLALGAVAAPNAQAHDRLAQLCASSLRPVVREELCAGARPGARRGPVGVNHAASGTGSGLDLGDVGIGAAGGIALSALGFMGGRVITARRTRRRIRTQVLAE